MSAKKIMGSFGQQVILAARQTQLELSTETVSIHKSGIEFRSPTAFHEWSEMTVTLQSPQDGAKISCAGVVVACTGTKHAGYHVSLVFTSLTPQTQQQLAVMARSPLGAGF
jgi:hypothetical protein